MASSSAQSWKFPWGAEASEGIDLDRESRSVGVFGAAAMRQFKSMSVLILGLDGVGAAAAKDLILTGPKAVALLDSKPAEPRDLGRNPFLTEGSLGSRIDEASLPHLTALNPGVRVSLFSPESGDGRTISAADVAKFDAVVACGGRSMEELTALNDLCRAAKPAAATETGRGCVAFYIGEARGAVTRMFCDLGPEHTMTDPRGMALEPLVVLSVSPSAKNPRRLAVLTASGDGGGLQVDDTYEVVFRGVTGPLGEILADGSAWQVKDTHGQSLEVELPEGAPDARDLGPWEPCHPRCSFRPIPATVASHSLAEGRALLFEGFPADTSFGMDAGGLHAAFEAGDAFVAKHGSAEALAGGADDAAMEEAVGMAREACDRLAAAVPEGASSLLPSGADVDPAVVRSVAGAWGAQLVTSATFVGGLIAHELFKLTGKFTPAVGWFYADHRGAVPREGDPLHSAPPAAASREPSRYDDVIDVLGPAALERMLGLRVFLVGAGAVGCEYLKLFPLLGVGCGEGGRVVVTDMDSIETSNLSRQFLFRQEHVGQPKSKVAAAAARAMNPALNAEPSLVRVGPGSEDTFGRGFWSGLDVVVCALDNIRARLYVQHKCVQSSVPMLDAGTQGGSGSSEPFIPGVTGLYSEDPDLDTEAKEVPVCTMKKYPTAPLHCIEFALSEFKGVFEGGAEAAARFRDAPDALEWVKHHLKVASRKKADAKAAKDGKSKVPPALADVPKSWAEAAERLEQALVVAGVAARGTWEACVEAAVLYFQRSFHDAPASLVHSFPHDMVVTDRVTGEVRPFWSGEKRPPTPVAFDAAVDAHLAFVAHAANVFAAVSGVPVPDGALDDREAVRRMAGAVRLPRFRPRAVVDDEPKEAEDGAAAASASSGAAAGARARAAEAKAAAERADEMDARIAAGRLLALARDSADVLASAPIRAEPFEKDSSTNSHVDFVTALANIRAASYGIDETPRHEVKITAGRIIPAIATTTDCVAAFGGLLLLQASQGEAAHGRLRALSSQLHLHQHFGMEINPPDKVKLAEGVAARHPEDLTPWHKVDVSVGAGTTVTELARAAGEAAMAGLEGATLLSLEVVATARVSHTIWAPDLDPTTTRANADKPARAVALAAAGMPDAADPIVTFVVGAEREDGEVVLPSVVVTFDA